MQKRFLLSTILILCCMFCCFYTVKAQTTQASISGTISDNQNAELAGATVQVKNESTGFTTATSTNAKGEYAFKELPLGGPYTVIVSYVGFGEQKRTGYLLHQGDAIKV